MLLQNYIYHTCSAIMEIHDRPETFFTTNNAIPYNALLKGVKELQNLTQRYHDFFNPHFTSGRQECDTMYQINTLCRDVISSPQETKTFKALTEYIKTNGLPHMNEAKWYHASNAKVLKTQEANQYVVSLEPFITQETATKCPGIMPTGLTQEIEVLEYARMANTQDGYYWETITHVPPANPFIDHLLFAPTGTTKTKLGTGTTEMRKYMDVTAMYMYVKWRKKPT